VNPFFFPEPFFFSPFFFDAFFFPSPFFFSPFLPSPFFPQSFFFSFGSSPFLFGSPFRSRFVSSPFRGQNSEYWSTSVLFGRSAAIM